MHALITFWEYIKYFSKVLFKFFAPLFNWIGSAFIKHPYKMIISIIIIVWFISSQNNNTLSSNEPVDANAEFFSGWNGSNPQFVDAVKSTMNDPSSFEHVETRFKDNNDGTLKLFMKFRGKNAFGAIITNTKGCTFDKNSKTITKIYD